MLSDPQVIGEGTYGCVHRPSMKCKNKNKQTPSDISKLMSEENAKQELTDYKLITNVDKEDSVYLGKPTKCKIDNIISNRFAMSKCKHNTYDSAKIDDYSLLIMKYGGLDLTNFGNLVYKWSKNIDSVRSIELFWLEVVRLFYGLKLFHDNGIIHHDLKPQNIVYNQEDNRVNYIDFGFMTTKKKVINAAKRSDYWLSENHHWSFPFEIVFWPKQKYLSIANDPTVIQSKAEIYAESVYKQGYPFFQMIAPVDHTKNYLKDLAIVASKRSFDLTKEFNKSNYNDFLEKSVDTVDSYGVGISLVYVLQRCKHLLTADLFNSLYAFSSEMITPNLYARLTPDQLLAKYEEILNTSGLLKKYSKHIANHLLADGKEQTTAAVSTVLGSDFLVIPKDKQDEFPEITRQCPDGKEYNPTTKRCVKTCRAGYERNAAFKCIKNKTRKVSYKVCPDGKQFNPNTNRCVKDCKPGYLRDHLFKCKPAGNPFA
jgi:serine/threonine protein kinase